VQKNYNTQILHDHVYYIYMSV